MGLIIIFITIYYEKGIHISDERHGKLTKGLATHVLTVKHKTICDGSVIN